MDEKVAASSDNKQSDLRYQTVGWGEEVEFLSRDVSAELEIDECFLPELFECVK